MKNHAPGDENPFGVYDYRDYAYTRYLIGFGGPLGRNPDVLKFFFSGEYRSKPSRLPTPERLQVYQNYILNIITQPVQNHKFKIMAMYQDYTGGIWSVVVLLGIHIYISHFSGVGEEESGETLITFGEVSLGLCAPASFRFLHRGRGGLSSSTPRR